jgi:hypothetical protein
MTATNNTSRLREEAQRVSEHKKGERRDGQRLLCTGAVGLLADRLAEHRFGLLRGRFRTLRGRFRAARCCLGTLRSGIDHLGV